MPPGSAARQTRAKARLLSFRSLPNPAVFRHDGASRPERGERRHETYRNSRRTRRGRRSFRIAGGDQPRAAGPRRKAGLHRRRDQDHPLPRAVAGARAIRSEQPGLGETRRDRVRDAPVLRSAPLRKRNAVVLELPRAGAQLDRQPHARRRHERGRSQHADARESAREPLVRMERRVRQPVVPEPAPDPRPARAGRDAAPRGAARARRRAAVLPPPADDEAVFVDVGKALAAFQETLVSGRTPFDRFRDALAKATEPPLGTYSEPAQRGLKIFIGKGGCTTCHSGPNFTGGEFFNTGLSRFAPRGQPDAGRQDAIRQLMENRFNLLGPYNDDKTGTMAARTREASLEKASFGEFKVPSLRNLILTAPYGRDGGAETLAEVVRHYAALDPVRLHAKDGRPAKPLNLTPREQTDLVVFLESLSTFSNPWRPDDGGQCY